MTFWAEYKVEVAVVLVALSVAARVLPQLRPRSSMSMIHTCSEAPSVRPPLMDAASELRAGLVVKHTKKSGAYSAFDVRVCVDLCFVCFIKLI